MEYFLSSNCIICKGHKRNIICDLQKENIYKVSDEILLYLDSKIEFKELSEEDTLLLEKLIEKEIVILLPPVIGKQVLPMSMNYSYNKIIDNCIIEIDKEIFAAHETFLIQLIDIGCNHLEIRFLNNFFTSFVLIINKITSKSVVESISIYLSFDEFIKYKDFLSDIRGKNLRFVCFYIFNVPPNIKYDNLPFWFVFLGQSDIKKIYCGIIVPFYFAVNVHVFTEAQQHNTCLNRKISIDANGNIKNCPSMPQSFGNIQNTTIEEATLHPEFKKKLVH